MRFYCATSRRRLAVSKATEFNGIDYLEVQDTPQMRPKDRQRILNVHFLKKNHLAGIGLQNIRIEGGDTITDVAVSKVSIPTDGPQEVLEVTLNRQGDFSTYTLRLVHNLASDEPPPHFEPILARVDFTFQVEASASFDLAAQRQPQLPALPAPYIDYLAKDYASFRRLMLDRLAVTLPGWQEDNPADVGVALVELLAYAGDHLSYYQDAVATEAYLDTARKRTSVRRHALLLDYHIHTGCNARVWACLHVEKPADGRRLDSGVQLLTGFDESRYKRLHDSKSKALPEGIAPKKANEEHHPPGLAISENQEQQEHDQEEDKTSKEHHPPGLARIADPGHPKHNPGGPVDE
ncbi:MAG: hypothetical protein V3W14_06300 [Candidatus Neomarinimicrobiota bacterium]